MGSRTGNLGGGSFGGSEANFYNDTFPDSGSFNKRESSYGGSASFGGGSGAYGGGSKSFSGGSKAFGGGSKSFGGGSKAFGGASKAISGGFGAFNDDSSSYGGGSSAYGGATGAYGGNSGGSGAYGIGARRDQSSSFGADNVKSSGYGSGASSGMDKQCIVKMRGLPFSANSLEIFNFFSSVAEVADCEIHSNDSGRPAGTASVLFNSEREARAALKLNKKEIGNRYIELFFEGPV